MFFTGTDPALSWRVEMTRDDSLEKEGIRSSEESKRLIDAHYRDINDILEQAEKKAKDIQQQAMESIPPWLDYEIATKLSYEHTPELLEEQIKLFSDDMAHDPALLDKTLYLLRLRDAHDIDRHLLAFMLADTVPEARFSLKAAAVYWIGALMREIELLEDILSSKDLIELLHRMKSHELVEKRHAPLRATYDDALKIAEEKWKKGEPALHHEMADYLEGKFPGLSYTTLKKRLGPVAKKYGRKFGLPGVKKEK